MKNFRLNRLFHATSRRCLALAFDPHPVAAAERREPALEAWTTAGFNAAQLTIGQAEALQSLPGRQKPELVLQGDMSNIAGNDAAHPLFCRILGNAVEQALRLDAAAISVHLVSVAEHPEITAQSQENVSKIKADCERWCLPLWVRLEAFQLDAAANRYVPDHASESIAPLLSTALKIGADLIEVGPFDEPDDLAALLSAMGGIQMFYRAPLKDVLGSARKAFHHGATGVVCHQALLRNSDGASLCQTLGTLAHGDRAGMG